MSPSLVTIYGLQAILAKDGDRLTLGTLRSYVSRGELPDPAQVINGVRLWDVEEVYARLQQMKEENPKAVPAPPHFQPACAEFVPQLQGHSEREQALWLLDHGREDADDRRARAANIAASLEAVRTEVRMEAEAQDQRRGAAAVLGRWRANPRLRATEATTEGMGPIREELLAQAEILDQDVSAALGWMDQLKNWAIWRTDQENKQLNSRAYAKDREALAKILQMDSRGLVPVEQWVLENPQRMASALMPADFTRTVEGVQDYLQNHPHTLNGRQLAGADFGYEWNGEALGRGNDLWRLSWIEQTRELYLVNLSVNGSAAVVLVVATTPAGTTLAQMFRWLGPLERACREKNSIGALLKDVQLQQKARWPSLGALV